MAQSGYTPINLYYSITGGNTPTVGNLSLGELAVNLADQKVYTLNSAGNSVITLVGTLGNQNANSVSITGGTINGTTIGASTASSGAFTTLSASSTVSGTGFSTYLSSPPAIGNTAANTGAFTTLSASSTVSGTGFSTYLASPPAIGGTTPAAGSFTTLTATKFNSASTFNFKNRIINGAMEIDQRNNGASITPNYSYTVDRWFVANTQTGKLTAQQNAGSVTPPAGFINYLGLTSTSAYSVGSGDTFYLVQKIEGLNVADLAFGTSSASNVNLSFKVYSSLTGTFGGALQNSASNRSYPFSYTVSSANTWTNITISIPGDTSGTWLTTSGVGIQVIFGLGSGSTFSGTAGSWASGNYNQPSSTVSVVGTNAATFYITGVQFEAGNIQTTFDVRDYGRESYLCYRYCETATTPTNYSVLVNASFVNYVSRTIGFQAIKRASPTVTVTVTNYDNAASGNGTIEFVSTQGFNHGQGISLTGFPYNAISIAYLATAEL